MSVSFHLEAGHRTDASGAIPTRAFSTLRQHETNAARLLRDSGAGLVEDEAAQLRRVVEWFSAQHERWSRSTIAAYRAALFCLVEHAESDGRICSALSSALFATLTEKVRPRSARMAPRTSARKAKAITEAEHRGLCSFLVNKKDPTSRLVAWLVFFGVELGLRPVEYFHASLEGATLRVRCAKNTNGRGVAGFRTIDMSSWSPRKLQAFRDFLTRLQAETRKAGDFKRMHQRLAKCLERACKSIKIRKIALYTLRHQAISTAKKNNVKPAEIAAFAGHRSTRTATTSYAKRRAGWNRKVTVRATGDIVALVRLAPVGWVPTGARLSSAHLALN